MQRTHRLRMVGVEESGLEEWACPVCGRRLLLRWPPDCHKQVVVRGDEEACHVADGAADDVAEGGVAGGEAAAGRGPAARPARRAGTAAATRRRLRETGVRLTAGHGPARSA
ncbi:hypothetical protein [Actinomadura algeriensis]|uniref:Uncharacterized protein n=1 Tax=Actinomadura algeriensis TaxID=1679523 RepID=A0ABR9K1U2_9ACTN|nr:hypothetical protein [Actinomadura algeriensis]MBE1536295.1 hypothetical protein [Actinomadura algeriensis]